GRTAAPYCSRCPGVRRRRIATRWRRSSEPWRRSPLDTLGAMAPKKSRTPPPPRRPVQAPKRRDTPPTRSTQRSPGERRRWLILGGAGAAIVALIVVLVVVFATGGAGASVQKTLSAAGCSYKVVDVHSRAHVQSLTAKIKYATFPAVGGPHYYQPMPFDRYPTPVAEVQKVHNLEHGAVVIQYGGKVPQAAIDEIGRFY